MGVWRVGTNELATSRFTVSAFTETVAALGILAGAPARPGLGEWARRYRPLYRERVSGDPVAAAFVEAALRPHWIADFLAVPPMRSDRTFHDELHRVRATPAAQVRRDLAVAGRLPAVLRRGDVAGPAADLLEWVWVATVRPDWGRRRRIFEADIMTRTHKVGADGWAAALEGMRPGLRWLGDGRLQINRYDNPPRQIADAELMFIPCTAQRGWVSWDEPHRYAIVYPCSGLLADVEEPAPPMALARLIGEVRAAILVQLADAGSTSQLVARTGYSLGSVGGHLKVLLDAELVNRRRVGRSVLYRRTALGERLTSRPAGESRPHGSAAAGRRRSVGPATHR
jgi:DNA-binding transcriptional ArsR family regulator